MSDALYKSTIPNQIRIIFKFRAAVVNDIVKKLILATETMNHRIFLNIKFLVRELKLHESALFGQWRVSMRCIEPKQHLRPHTKEFML